MTKIVIAAAIILTGIGALAYIISTPTHNVVPPKPAIVTVTVAPTPSSETQLNEYEEFMLCAERARILVEGARPAIGMPTPKPDFTQCFRPHLYADR